LRGDVRTEKYLSLSVSDDYHGSGGRAFCQADICEGRALFVSGAAASTLVNLRSSSSDKYALARTVERIVTADFSKAAFLLRDVNSLGSIS